MANLYLYLAKRDRKGIKLITTFQGLSTMPVRIVNLVELRLDKHFLESIEKIVDDNRMEYDLWLESANSCEDLKNKLLSRGYEVPIRISQMMTGNNVADTRKIGNRKVMAKNLNY